MSVPTKMAKIGQYIATHDQTFHCDDVTACYILKSLERFKNHSIIRTRDPQLLADADIVVDVGDVFDAEKLRLDHHQRSFQLTIRDFYPELSVTNSEKPPRLSSSGLVYTIFGKDYITQQLELGEHYNDLNDDKKKMVESIFDKAYIEFFEEIDAIDNGVNIASGDNIVYNYNINSGISSRVGRYNPIDNNASPEHRLEQFKKAMNLVGAEISEGVKYLATVWWPMRQQFREFVLKRKNIDPSGQIVHIEGDNLTGWKSSIYELEDELGIPGEIKFIIWHSDSKTTPWRTLAVPKQPKSFECRIPLKEEWRGQRDEKLQGLSGVPGALFVHNSGFTGGAKSFEDMLALVRKTLDLEG